MSEIDTNEEHYKKVNVYQLTSAMEGFKQGIKFSSSKETQNVVNILVDMINQYLK